MMAHYLRFQQDDRKLGYFPICNKKQTVIIMVHFLTRISVVETEKASKNMVSKMEGG